MDAAPESSGPEPIPSATLQGDIAAKPMATMSAPAQSGAVRKVIVAVHGIGDQYSFATIQAVANQFCAYHGRPAGVSLGNFHGNPAYAIPEPQSGQPFEGLAFGEVYWASIPRDVVKEKYTLEEAKKWAGTIVERLRLRWWAEGKKGECSEADFEMTQRVLGEMIQTIAVVDRICFLADKAGLFTFDLKKLLDDYLGDVQLVAEFKDQRKKIIDTFTGLLDRVSQTFQDAEIYLVAHSEGTVVTLLGLLQAFREPQPPAWTRKVRGLMTLGSPIDKHLVLWPDLFGKGGPTVDPPRKIEWRNYYDFGDPVGFELDGIRAWLKENGWNGVFHFEADHDHGFTRYPFPGKAHVDYWTDKEVFGHFISEVVQEKPPEEAKPKPADRKQNQWLSYLLPYAGVFALLVAAAYVLSKAVFEATGFTGYPNADGVRPEKLGYVFLFLQVGGLAALLLGVTVAARIPRLTRSILWRTIGFLVGIGAGLVYLASVHGAAPTLIGTFSIPPGGITLGVAILVVVVSVLVSRKLPALGLTPLMVLGAAGAVAMVASHLQDAPGPFWPVVLATVAFLYLWWLAALLFDLVFVWHLYIRHSNLMRRIHQVVGDGVAKQDPALSRQARQAA